MPCRFRVQLVADRQPKSTHYHKMPQIAEELRRCKYRSADLLKAVKVLNTCAKCPKYCEEESSQTIDEPPLPWITSPWQAGTMASLA
ncbi:hypothetical protein AVEN_258810-1 [Araneus ventricosus]|uniref:Uncharacterized protein n=1 Tax=Araneus ventricosus TaxID=182803 RepID=A0A4Y2UFV6_ARAVE|nr:hypothetical protein AVEN_258810-1 [Araneus ventricosus]